VPQEEGAGQMKWKVGGVEYETVAQYLAVVQKNHFFAMAAGVVVHQHTRVLVADLHRRGDDMSVEGVQTGLQQLAAELAAAYKAAAVGPTEIQRVVVESASGPEGRAAVQGRVADANSRIAETLCSCAVCVRAATNIRGQLELAQEEH